MRKNPFQKMIMPLTIMYIGFMLIFITFFLDMYSTLFSVLGQFILTLGVITLFYEKLSKKMDNISMSHTNMKNAGIDQIIPAENRGYETLESLIKKSDRVEIILNTSRFSDRLYYLINSLIEDYGSIKFKLLIADTSDDFKEGDFKKSHKRHYIESLTSKTRENENVEMRIVHNLHIDNLILFDDNVCYTHYNVYDNKPFMFIIFNEHDDGHRNYRKYFYSLWDKSEHMDGWEG